MTGTKEKKFYGITRISSRLAPQQEMDDNGIQDDIASYGGGGGSGMDNLDKRVTALEEDVKVIRNDLTTLMVRSESFATKADISDIRTEMAEYRGSIKQEMAESRGSIKQEMAAQRAEIKEEMAAQRGEIKEEMAAHRGEIKAEMAAHRGEIKAEMAALRGELKAAILESQQFLLKEMESRFDKLADKTRWKWSAVFIPLGVGIAGVLATLLASYLTS
ncbi:apolipoprotein A1/A4/E family protein [Enterobacter hormaechei]|nr:apolipoprotein A1/A4/E family protein [Enterobacter hormaechei]